jgi:hypothetical protein
MIVNQLTSTNSSRLNQIMHTLKHVHRFELSAHEKLNLSETQHHYEAVKKQIVETSEFNSYHTNPEYTKAALITEAVKLLKEIAPSRRKTVKEHQELAESMHEYKKGDKVQYKGKTCRVVKFTKGPMIGLEIDGKMDMVDVKHVKPCGVEEGILKNIKRGLQGWDKNAIGPSGEKLGDPRAVVNRAKEMDIATATSVRASLSDKALAHSPAGLQKRALDRRLAKSVVSEKLNMSEQRLKIMMEDESLDKAETILAAKNLSDKLQGMAEDAAKMAVDKLMPLVDVMKSQFGQDPADGFNDVVKAQLQTVLDAIITAKDETDNAILALQGGETPSMPTNISQPLPSEEPSADGAAPDEFGFDQEFSAGPETAGPEQEPLGRGMKSTMNESKFTVGDDVEFDYAKNMKPVKGKVVEIVPTKKTSQNPHGYMVDVKSGNTIYSLHPDHPKKLMEAINNSQDHNDLVADAALGAMTGKNKKGQTVNKKDAKDTLKALTNIKEAAKKPRSPYAIGTAKAMELTGDTPPLKKSTITKAHEIARSIEKATQKEGKINNLKVVIESLKTEFNNLKREFNAQCEIHKQSVMEGTVMDVTQVGYGLEGAAILHKINHVKSQIQETQERLTALVKQAKAEQQFTRMTNTKITALSEQAQHMPYGIVGVHTTGAKFKKFFESADHRQLWLDYNQSSIAEQQHINPEDLARIRRRLKGTI